MKKSEVFVDLPVLCVLGTMIVQSKHLFDAHGELIAVNDMFFAQSPLSDDWGLNRVKVWELKFCLFPKKCFLSKKPLWFRMAYRGKLWLHGPGEPVIDTYWINKHEFLLWRLKKSN